MNLQLFSNAMLFDSTGSDPVNPAWVIVEGGIIRDRQGWLKQTRLVGSSESNENYC